MQLPIAYGKCIICLERAPDTWEHIVPESIGGILQVRFLCQRCNSQLGTEVVSGLRKDPRIRLALENLRTKLPALAERAQEGLPYIARRQDGGVVRVSKKAGRWRVHEQTEADGSRILDSQTVKDALAKYLKRTGHPTEVTKFWQDKMEKARDGEPILLPTGQITVKKHHTGPAMPALSAEFVSDRLPVQIAYEFLALLLYDQVYGEAFDLVRRYIRTGEPYERVTVQHLSAREYGAGHMVDMSVAEKAFTVYVRLFRWLVFGVKFSGYIYQAQQAILVEDLEAGNTKIALPSKTSPGWDWRTISLPTAT